MKQRQRAITSYRPLTPVTSSAELGETAAEWERVADLLTRGLLIYRDKSDPFYLLVALPEWVNEDLHQLEDELACIAEAAALSDVYAAPGETMVAGEVGWEVILTAPVEDRAAALTELAQFCQQADDLIEQVYNRLEEMQQAGDLTSAEYDLLIAVVPRTNLHELRQRLLLAAAGKLRPRYLSKLLGDLLG